MSRKKILQVLKEHPEEFVSGESISEQLGITRAAVWKGVDALRKEGYEIESRTRRGYRLLTEPEILCAGDLASRLCTEVVGRSIECFDRLDSTNLYLKQAVLRKAENGHVVLAEEQTAGRGRCGRVFQSPRGKGLYLSALLMPKVSPAAMIPVTAAAAVAVCNAVERVCGVRPWIKWTNDLVLQGKKLCGILTEMSIESESGALESVVVGIGVNVNQDAADFEGEVADMATSLKIVLGKTVSRAELAAAIIEELDGLYGRIDTGFAGLLEEYRRDCITLGRQVQILGSGEPRLGTAVDIDDNFGLVVMHGDGSRETVRSGEVSVRGMYGYV